MGPTESDSSAKQLTRSILTIDLNETPSPSETLPSPNPLSSSAVVSPTAVVRCIHENPAPAEGAPADIPGEGRPAACAACGRIDARGHVVVCDGCERVFHLGCAGVKGSSGREVAAGLVEWLCGECVSGGVGSRRWPLGKKKSGTGGDLRLLDMNASPPSEGDGGGGEERKMGEVRRVVEVEDSRTSGAQFFEEVKFASQSGRVGSSSARSTKLPIWDPRDIFLHSLREFITERHGVLPEGWHVEFKQSRNSHESCAVYCAPEGNTFGTMSEVASYLGLMPNGISKEPKATTANGSASLWRGLHAQNRGKLSKSLVGNIFAEVEGSMVAGLSSEVFGSARSWHLCASKSCQNLDVMEAEKEGDLEHPVYDGLPIQYEDFFVLTLGLVDARPAYHDTDHIWPVGYRSCWHDKVTGSLFLCDVVDDGDTGPLFRVKRFSCSSL
ncbi:Methyl-CpG-binding domain-containing protein, partial [Drosera capensis]